MTESRSFCVHFFFCFVLRFTTKFQEEERASFHAIALETDLFFAPNPIIFGFILTSRIHHNFGEKKTPREREREYEREKKKEKSARCDFYYRVVDLVVVVVVSSLLLSSFLCVLRVVVRKRNKREDKNGRRREKLSVGRRFFAYFFPAKREDEEGENEVERG